jgi:rod shape-determining protein MreD
LIVVVFLGLREPGVWGGVLVAILGLLTDTFSGLYLGLTLFSYLSIYLILRKAAVHLYTESGYLFVTVVFFATILSGLFEMSLLLLFYVAGGGYKILSVMPTQALVNAMVASLVTFLMPSTTSPEVKP